MGLGWVQAWVGFRVVLGWRRVGLEHLSPFNAWCRVVGCLRLSTKLWRPCSSLWPTSSRLAWWRQISSRECLASPGHIPKLDLGARAFVLRLACCGRCRRRPGSHCRVLQPRARTANVGAETTASMRAPACCPTLGKKGQQSGSHRTALRRWLK